MSITTHLVEAAVVGHLLADVLHVHFDGWARETEAAHELKERARTLRKKSATGAARMGAQQHSHRPRRVAGFAVDPLFEIAVSLSCLPTFHPPGAGLKGCAKGSATGGWVTLFLVALTEPDPWCFWLWYGPISW